VPSRIGQCYKASKNEVIYFMNQPFSLATIFINKCRAIKKIIKPLLLGGVSYNYVELSKESLPSESNRLIDAWKSKKIPQLQRKLVDAQLKKYACGDKVEVFDVLVNAVESCLSGVSAKSLLEIGCSSGYYSEVFVIAGLDVNYVGCDYSEEFIHLALDRYSGIKFDVQDATALDYQDASFDIVVSGCCLLHIPNYLTAILEAIRVSRDYVILHRTPILSKINTTYYKKIAYGVESIEIHFNEKEIIEFCLSNGLMLIDTLIIGQDQILEGNVGFSGTRTYLFKKV